MKLHSVIVFVAIITLGNCNNLGLLDKLADPGGTSTAGSSGGEKFTNNYYIFVSSWTTMANMSTSPYPECDVNTGANKADCACSRTAAANGLRKSSTHVFRAWLSTTTPTAADAKCRVQGLANGCITNIPGTWFNTQGQPIVNNFDGFNNANTVALQNAIRYSETGADVSPDLVWTGTNDTGVWAGTSSECTNWSSTAPTPTLAVVGSRIDPGMGWTVSSTVGCNTTQRVYCVAAP